MSYRVNLLALCRLDRFRAWTEMFTNIKRSSLQKVWVKLFQKYFMRLTPGAFVIKLFLSVIYQFL